MMKKMKHIFQNAVFTKARIRYSVGLFSVLTILSCGSPAYAQMENNAWTFKTQNRASIAALIQQVENADNAQAATVTNGSSGFDQLVCGGDSGSSATGNSTCIILNNSDGAIQIGQDAQGSQDAENTEDTTLNGLSDALQTIDDES